MKEVSAARKEYTHQLMSIMVPIVYDRVKHTYLKAKRKPSEKSPLVEFQLALREYKDWSSLRVQNELTKMTERASYFEDLITAIFVTSVRIMSAVQLGGAPKKFSLDPPSAESFVHAAYIRTARSLYYKPTLFDESEYPILENNREEVEKLIRESIDESIRSMLPVKSILESYLSTQTEEADASTTDASQHVEHPSRLVAEAEEIKSSEPIDVPEDGSDTSDEDRDDSSSPEERVDAPSEKGKEPARSEDDGDERPRVPPSDIKEVRLDKGSSSKYDPQPSTSAGSKPVEDTDEPFFSDAEEESAEPRRTS